MKKLIIILILFCSIQGFGQSRILTYLRMNGNSTAAVGNNGTNTSMSFSTINGKVNGSATYSLVTSNVAVTISDPDLYNNGLTISCWVYFNSLRSTNFIFNNNETASWGAIFIAYQTANWYYRFGSGSSATSYNTGITAEAGKWYHIVITHNTSFNKMYINGKLIHSATSATLANNGTSGNIGNYAVSKDLALDGKIDDFQYISGYWSEAIVVNEYLKGLGQFSN